MWNEFVELPEQQQEHIVKIATDKKKKKKIRQERIKDDTKSNSCSSDENFETFVLIENHTTTNDQKSIDPLRQQGNFI
jgi:hypothetical protein